MPRNTRIQFKGGLYHIMNRGNLKQNIFVTPNDKENFFNILSKICKNFNWICHSYCLMSNHYHLLIETPDGNLSHGMQILNSTYSRKFNIKYGLTGHLFQGRYKSVIVEKDSYLLELSRYIVLNPVRAK